MRSWQHHIGIVVLVFAILMAQEAYRIDGVTDKWLVFGTIQEFTKALLCALLAYRSPLWQRTYWGGAVVWFMVQGVQELKGENEGDHETWEYDVLILYFITMLIITYSKVEERGR